MKTPDIFGDFSEYLRQLFFYIRKFIYKWFFRFESGKGVVVGGLYKKRGKYARPFLHSAMMAFLFFGVAFGPKVVAEAFPGKEEGVWDEAGVVLGETAISLNDTGLVTLESDKPRAQVLEYSVKDGDTLSTVAERFDISSETLKWANPKVNWKRIKPGDVINVPPVTGVVYKVKTGDTIYSISKKYSASAQAVVDYPFNSFANDEEFTLVVGQVLIIPDGIVPSAVSVSTRFAAVLTPDAGSVSATGSFVWPAYGRLTQGYRWYHKGIDVANKSGGSVLGADAGRVITAGWTSSGYGYHVIVDHGNGYQTLYAHMSSVSVVVGQSVARGSVLGNMGNTGRSTGTHLHFEIIRGGVRVNPFDYLQ